jgi:hypothetical protein
MLRFAIEDVIVEVRGRVQFPYVRLGRVVMSMIRRIEDERPRADGDCCVQDVCAVQETLDTKQVSELVADFLAGLDSCSTVGV